MSKEKEETEGSARKRIKLDEETANDDFFPQSERLELDKIYPVRCDIIFFKVIYKLL